MASCIWQQWYAIMDGIEKEAYKAGIQMIRKRVTMKDIADRLHLSVNAVSLALNDKTGVGEETKRLILDTAEEMGYLDQSVKYTQTYSNKNLCVLLKNRFFRDFRFYGRVLLGIEEEAKKAGYDVFINSFETEDIPACVESRKVAGIIVVGKIGDSFLCRLKEYRIPIVLADHISLEEKVDCVMSDNKLGSYKMVSYLYEKGFRRIGYVGDLSYSPSTRERFYGYQEAIQHCFGVSMPEESMAYVQKYSLLTEVEELVIRQDREALYGRFLDIREKPDALICSNDELAILLMKVLQEHGYVIPGDIAVAGFDDIEPARMVTPGLTTVHVSKKLMGQNATKRLLHRIANPKDQVEKLVMSVDIVERDSTGRADKDCK